MFFLLPETASAHKVRVFAYGEGNTIVGESAFSGGRKAKNAEILVQDTAGDEQLFSCRTDEQGQFRFNIPDEARKTRMDLRIIVKAGDGHRGEWLLAAADYLEDVQEAIPTSPPRSVVESRADSAVSAAEEEEGRPAQNAAELSAVPLQQIQQLMEETLDKKLAPVKHILAQANDPGPTLQDILGGIGYIIGLAGIAAYFKAGQRKKEKGKC